MDSNPRSPQEESSDFHLRYARRINSRTSAHPLLRYLATKNAPPQGFGGNQVRLEAGIAAAAALWGFEHLLALAKRVRRRPRTALAVLWVGERCGEFAERMLGERH